MYSVHDHDHDVGRAGRLDRLVRWLERLPRRRGIQEQLRFADTGRHEQGNRGATPYSRLVGSGYLPLVTAFRAYMCGRGDYEAVLDRRLCGVALQKL